MIRILSCFIFALLCTCQTGCHTQATLAAGGANSNATQADDGTLVKEGIFNDVQVFKKGQRQNYRVPSDLPLAIGFDADIPSGLVQKIFAKAEATGVFEDNYAGEVSSNSDRNGIGSLHGGYIVLEPKEGWIDFGFTNHLDQDFEFEVYAKPVPE